MEFKLPKPLKEYQFRSGSRAGQTFEQVANSDKGFCEWVLSKQFPDDSALGRFKTYLISK